MAHARLRWGWDVAVAVAGVGWPRAVPHNSTHLYVFYSAGGIDFWTNGTNHIADTGLVSAAATVDAWL